MAHSMAEEVLGDSVRGMIAVESYKGEVIPLDKWDVVSPMGDIVMAEYVDTSDGENIERGGLVIPKSMNEKTWRVCKVLKKGPEVSETITEGGYIITPGDKGIPAIMLVKDGKSKNILFINEARIFCVVRPRE